MSPRKDRVRRALAVGVFVVLAAVLPACGSRGVRGGSLKAGDNPGAQRLYGKKRGGTLTVYTTRDFHNLDPGQSWYTLDYAVIDATQRPLFAYLPNSDSKLSPDLAAYVPTVANGGVTDGGRTVVVHIRTDVHFGPPVNRAVISADVAYAVERGANPNVANPYFATYFGSRATAPLQGAQSPGYRGGPIPGIRTPNSGTIVFHMTRPGAALLIQALTLPLSAPVPESFAGPLDRRGPTAYGTNFLVATGPYMPESDASGRFAGIGYVPGKRLTLVRNPNWNPATDYRPGYLNRIDIEIGGSPEVIGEQVLKGSDAIELEEPTDSIVQQASASYRSLITFTQGGGVHYMALDNAAGPMRNVDVRRAVWAAVDRAAIARASGGPLLAEPATHFIYPGVIGYAQAGGAQGPRADYNVDLDGNLSVAEKYMKLAGYPSGKYTGKATVEIVAARDGHYPAVTQIDDRAFTSLGFRTRVIEVDDGEMYFKYCGAPNQEVDACPSVGWIRDFADPQSVLYDTFYGSSITPSNNVNWSQVNDPQINAAINRAALVVDPVARARAWARVDTLLVDQAVAVPETFDSVASIESADVAGVNAIWDTGVWDLDFTSLK